MEPTQRKLRGGYYTPAPIPKFLAAWAIPRGDARVLEPCCGDGALVEAARECLSDTGEITAVELFAEEALKTVERSGAQTSVHVGDAFSWFRNSKCDSQFDAVIGNPPFIRYQTFPEPHRDAAFQTMREEDLHPSRLTNAWVPFVVLATRCLRQGGRLALVLPAELLQVTYASELREYLVRNYSHLTVVTFRRLLFAGTQQETILLLGTRKTNSAAKISWVELDSAEDLSLRAVNKVGKVEADLDHAREKWTQFYLSPAELGLIREIESSNAFTTLGELAEVDVGIVTGRNEFFVLTHLEAEALGVQKWCRPLVGRSAQIPGLVLTPEDWRNLLLAESKCLLLQLGDCDRNGLAPKALAYVRSGERRGLHKGYKCQIRLPQWWDVPSDWVPDAFLLRQIHHGPRVILNRALATCTDTIHRIRVRGGVDPSFLAAASMNSLIYAFSEVRGRSYGGGVLELEPSEAESLPFPIPTSRIDASDLDLWARHKPVEDVLDEIDRLVLRDSGLSKAEMTGLRNIWRRLSQRRTSRRRAKVA